MFRPLRWKSANRDIESQLRAIRPEAHEDFVEQLTWNVGGRPRRASARLSSRLAFAAAFTTLILGTFASFGGLGYAASGASHTYRLVSELAVNHHVTVHHSSAAAQYPPAPGGGVGSQTHVNTPAASAQGALGAAAQTGTLPFTGLSLLGTFVIAALLTALGLVLRRRAGTNS